MTSIISPIATANHFATLAQDSLKLASAALRAGTDRQTTNPARIGIPEHSGPDTPDNPWFVRPSNPTQAAAEHARVAIAHIETTLQLSTMYSTSARDAFTRARDEAVAGVRELTVQHVKPIRPEQVALTFDAASMWLNVGMSQLALSGQPDPTIIQLPDPSSPIQ